MKPLKHTVWSGRIPNPTPPAHCFFTIHVMLLLVLSGVAHSATNSVTSLADSGAGSLRQVIADSIPGDTINFSVMGTITLTSSQLVVAKDLTILGPGLPALVISGNNSVRVFYVNTNVDFILSDLTVANGVGDKGAGVLNFGGNVALFHCSLVNNAAIGPAAGSDSGNPGTNGFGGAVYNRGVLSAVNCTFLSNSVAGGAGAVLAMSSGAGGAGGDGNGGAIANVGELLMSGCLLAQNVARGGAGAAGSAGFYGCPGLPGGAGGNGGSGNGGAMFNDGVAYLVNDTFAENAASGGDAGSGGSGGPPMSSSCRTGDGAYGGVGGSGYSALYDANGQCYLTNCTVAFNTATRGLGGPGGPAGPWLYPYPYPPLLGAPGGNGANGAPGGGFHTTGTRLLNTLLSSNTPANGVGTVTDAGHNLSSDASYAFSDPSSRTNTNPTIGVLADNGGLTLTIALLSGSPAIDAGDASGAPATDQRGIARPQGLGLDIGAFEFQCVIPRITAARFQSASSFWLQSWGKPGKTYRLQTSTNLLSWSDVATLCGDLNGMCEFLDSNLGTSSLRFYRMQSVAPEN